MDNANKRKGMADHHVIRLRGPWEYLAPAGDEQRDPPIQGDGAAFRCRRRFHCPSGLTPEAAVWLVIGGGRSAARAALNDAALGPIAGDGQPAQFEITQRLQPHNQLTIEVEVPGEAEADTPHSWPSGRREGHCLPAARRGGPPDAWIGPVWLEIRLGSPASPPSRQEPR